MWNGFRLFTLAALGVAVCSLAARGADDPKKDDDQSKPVQFETADGVQLEGRFYAAARRARPKPRKRPYSYCTTLTQRPEAAATSQGGTSWPRLCKPMAFPS